MKLILVLALVAVAVNGLKVNSRRPSSFALMSRALILS